MVRGRGLITLVAGATLVAGMAAAIPAASAATTAGAAAAAPGAPGAPSYFDLARKDCVGTAATQGSKVWYTVADGVLSDVYEPTIDNTNVSTLQYVVTDGVHVHRPADPGHDLHGRRRSDRHGLHRHLDRRQARLPAGHHLHHRPGQRHRADEHPAAGPARLEHQPGRRCTCTRGSTPTSTATAAAEAQNAGANSGVVDTSAGRRSRWSSARTRSPTPPTGTTRCRPTWRWPRTSAPAASVGYAGTASDGLTQLDTSHALTAVHLRAGRPRRGHRGRDPRPRRPR